MTIQFEDITGDIGDLFPHNEPPKYPMYSYDRPAFTFWQGYYEVLREHGYTHDEAIKELQSRLVRHQLDGFSEVIKDLGRTMAQQMFQKNS